MDENTLEFDMVGIDAAIANAFRRILLAEVVEDVRGLEWGNYHHLICRNVPKAIPSRQVGQVTPLR